MNALPQVTWLEGIAHLRMASGHLDLHCFLPRIRLFLILGKPVIKITRL